MKVKQGNNDKRSQVIERIIHLVNIMNIQSLYGWEDFDFSKITTLRNRNNILLEELVVLQEELEQMFDYRLQYPVPSESLLGVQRVNRNWKSVIPSVVKETIPNWETKNINLIELYAKDLLRFSRKGEDKKEITEFLEYIGSYPTISVLDESIDKIRTQGKKSNEEEWRMSAPDMVREYVAEWEIISIADMKEEVTELITIAKDSATKNELKNYLVRIEKILPKEDFNQELIPENSLLDNFERELVPDDSELEEWRKSAPTYVKESIPNWKSISLIEMEHEVYDLITVTKKRVLKIELEDYLGYLEDLHYHADDYFEDTQAETPETLDVFNPLDVLEKYKNGAVVVDDEEKQKEIDETWRKLVPNILKQQIKDWKKAPINLVYDQAKEIMGNYPIYRNDIMPFIVELSQIIFEENEIDDGIEEQTEFRDEISDSIMSLVEMIILPHLEVMDLIQQRGGSITFRDLWHKPFTEELKQEVKDRDGWKCVICESETDLHVHHKIPRNKGGIHHKENLVTLCASCHGAVETADIQHAFKKCLANYKKRKFSQISRHNLSQDKKLLKDEVEKSLDALLFELNNKEEHTLVENVLGIMKRLEIIFYD